MPDMIRPELDRFKANPRRDCGFVDTVAAPETKAALGAAFPSAYLCRSPPCRAAA